MSRPQRVLLVCAFLLGSAAGAPVGGSLERAPDGLPQGVEAAAPQTSAMPSGPGAEPYYAQPGLPKGVDSADPVTEGQPQASTVETAALADAKRPDLGGLAALNAAAKALQPNSPVAQALSAVPIPETPGSKAYLAPAGLPKGVDP